jgi:OOP family OmpA-OmpF porin
MRALVTVLLLTLAAPALAQESVSLSTDAASESGSRDGTVELGIYGGLLLPATKHELYEPKNGLADLGHHPLAKLAPDLGLRFAYVPVEVFALEAEAGIMPTKTRDTKDSVIAYAARAHLMFMAPTETIVPFLVLGAGVLGASSDAAVLGSDNDPELHVGIGAKAYVTRGFLLRLDLRDNFSSAYLDDPNIAMHWEALFGVSLVLGQGEPPKPIDTDGDGIPDRNDKCQLDPGPAPDGCPPPPPPPDSDGDGIADPSDACPNQAGPANADAQKNGCPPPPDRDGDGVADDGDACPDVAGDGPDGCPLDTDGDGLIDRDDKCPNEAETKNGFEDADGCPDEVPQAVQAFMGVIEGITFDTNKATIRKSSFKALDAAAKILTDYPSLRLEVSGHTDSSGKAERNDELSKERAEAVRDYLAGKGIGSDRLEAVGHGSSLPIADNKTAKGRSQNRRIEFKVLVQ